MVVQSDFQHDLVSSPLKNDKKHRLKQRFDVQKKLGQGTYGKVQLAVNRETGQEVAVKTIKKVKIECEQDLIRIRREIQIMSSIQHPHIIHIYEVFENKDKIVLVMQFASGGELYDYLSEKKVLSDVEARRIFRQIAAAVYYCHKNKICHRDLKLENILLDEKGNAKIADFGLSNVFDERNLLKTYCGSPLYASPEIVKGVPYYGPEVDCWSMGVLLYTLVYGAMPFDGSNFKKLVTQISEGDYFEPKKKSKASGLIRKLLTVNPLKRATIVDICMDYWVNEGYEHSLLQVAEDMANLTPVRLDLLLALAPTSPLPPDEAELLQQEGSESERCLPEENLIPERAAEEEEDDHDDDDNPETATNSFAYMKGSHASNFSASSPNLPETSQFDEEETEEFLPVDVAVALQNECAKRAAEKSFDGSLVRISSLAHKSKKPRKSDSIVHTCDNKTKIQNSVNNMHQNVIDEKKCAQSISKENNKISENIRDTTNSVEIKNTLQKEAIENVDAKVSVTNISKAAGNKSMSHVKDAETKVQICNTETSEKTAKKNLSATCDEMKKSDHSLRRESLTSVDKSDIEHKKVGRPPGKIIIPKTFDSPQSTPSPKIQSAKIVERTEDHLSSAEIREDKPQGKTTDIVKCSEEPKSVKKDLNSAVCVTSTSNVAHINETDQISEEKKILAKGILKKGIAKAKLAERKLSQQSSVESEITSSPSTAAETEVKPSFFKAPKPYSKTEEENKKVKSNAEIVLTPPVKQNYVDKPVENEQKAPVWNASSFSSNKELEHLPEKSSAGWRTLSSTLDSEISNWQEQVEESLKRLSPDQEERTSSSIVNSSRNEEDKPLVPIARSYKKFTFTKDGACITETKKIYTAPGADGSWTKVEKKTKITTRPGNADEFEKFRDLHLRNSSPLVKSDSQSSSGSNDIYDDIFDSWTGDTMLCNVMKMKNMFHKFSRDPFLRRDRRRNPFRHFRRTESERSQRRSELRGGFSDRESSDNEEDYEVHFDSANPVVYGSQGLWQFLQSSKRGFPGSISVTRHDPSRYSRSISQDRSESKLNCWKRSESRASSGYNTGSRAHSRDRTQSPREKVLRFVFETPSQEFANNSKPKSPPLRHDLWSSKRRSHNPRRDSGVGSDGYESEHSLRHIPSEDLSMSERVSPLSSVYSSGRTGILQDFVKSWSDDVASPPVSPVAFHLDRANDSSSKLAESRRHKVEQWLHLNDINSPNFPFGSDDPSNKVSQIKSDGVSSTYATMRPREYLRYNRSSSDKISDRGDDYFASFDDNRRYKSNYNVHNEKQDFFADGNKVRARTFNYSPVSEESSRETHSLNQSNSSQSNSSVHRINFTICDGRVSSSHTPPLNRSAQTFNDSQHGQIADENNSCYTKVHQVSSRGHGQPLVQMKVSFNRGNRENQYVHVTSEIPQTAKGLWHHQDQSSNSRVLPVRGVSVRECSPVPGIRKFSTEMVHTVTTAPDIRESRESKSSSVNAKENRNSPPIVEYEIKTLSRSSPENSPKG